MTPESKQQTRKTSLEVMSAGTITHLIHPLTQKAMFWRPVYIESSAWIEHIPFAFWIVEAHQPRVFVELGTHYGVSYFAFCQAVEKLELNTRCFAVDTWKGDEHAGFYDERVFEQVKAYNEAQYSGFSRMVRSTFDDALSHFSDGSIDLLHIDGLHTFEAVRHDFETWIPKLSERAVVVMHDTNVRERRFGVFKLFENLRERYPTFEFLHGHGLGVLKAGPRQTDQMLRFFNAAEKDQTKHDINEIFARLGRACADSIIVAQQRERVTNLKDQLDQQRKRLEEVNQNLKKSRIDLNKHTKELFDTRTKMQVKTEQHAVERGRLNEQVTFLQELRSELKQELSTMQTRIDITTTYLNQRDENLVRIERVNLEHQRQVNLASEKLKDNERTIASLQQTADNQRAEIKNLQRQMSEVKREFAAAKQTDASAIGRLRQEGNSQSEEIGRLQWYLGERDAEINQLSETLSVREQELDRMQSDLSQRNETVDRLQKALDGNFAETQVLNADLAEKNEENDNLTRCLTERKAALDKARMALQDREKEVVNYEQASKGRTKEIARLEQTVKDQERKLNEAWTNLDDRFKELAKLTEMVKVGETTIKTWKDKFKKLKQLYDEKLQEFTANCERLSEVQVKQQSLAEKLAVLSEENSCLTRRLAEMEAAFEVAKTSLQKREKNRSALRQQLKERSSTINQLKIELKDKGRELAEAKTNLDDRFRELATITMMLEEREAKLDEKIKLTKQLTQRNAELKAKDIEIEAQRQRVAKLKATVSWKITTPMRALVRPFRKIQKNTDPINKQVQLIRKSGLFDDAWYLEHYPDVMMYGGDPVEHYVRHGFSEQRNPGPSFDAQWYLDTYTDVAEEGKNPLVHYIMYGKKDGRRPSAK